MVGIDLGAGPVVVLVHGLGANHEDWRLVAPALAADYRVVAIDLPGFGKAAALDHAPDIKDFADALWRQLDEMKIDEVAALVGHSMGGAVAIEAALTQPARVARLAVLNSMPAFTPKTLRDYFELMYRRFMVRTLGPLRLAQISALRMFPDPADELLRAPIIARGETNKVGPYLMALNALVGWDARDRLATWRKPLLWLASEYDYFDFAPVRELRLKMPHARVRCYPGERHALPMSRPEAVTRELKAFMQQ